MLILLIRYKNNCQNLIICVKYNKCFLVNVAGRIFAINQTFLSHSLLRDAGGKERKGENFMKKAKVLVATVLASGLVLSGCSFEEALETAKNWPVQNVYEPAKAFFEEKILGKKPQEAEPEKEEKQDEGEKPAPAPVAQLLSISVSGQFKSEYDIGEAFDATGVVVTAAYDDGSTQDVSSQASFIFPIPNFLHSLHTQQYWEQYIEIAE